MSLFTVGNTSLPPLGGILPITLTVLGSGTCHPVPGGKRRHHPGFFIRWGADDKHLMFECSAHIAERLEQIGEPPDRVVRLAVSHAHPDHFALPGFVQTCLCCGLQRGIDLGRPEQFPQLQLLAPQHIVNSLEALNRIHFEENEGGKGLPFPVLKPVGLHGRCLVTLEDGVELISEPVRHGFGKVDAVAFSLNIHGTIIAYSGDSGLCDELIRVARGADLFICEASARIGDEEAAYKYGHLNPSQAGQVARAAGVKRLLLTHYSGADPDAAMIADCRRSGFEGKIEVAYDFQQIGL